MFGKLLSVIGLAVVAGMLAGGAGPSPPEPAALRQEVLDFLRGVHDLDFRGVVEFVKLMEIGPDPTKVERANKLAEEVDTTPRDDFLGAIQRFFRDQMRERELTAGLDGEAVKQAWRIVAGDSGKLRAEVQTHALHPPGGPVPVVSVAAKNGGTSWLWRGPLPGYLDGAGPVSHPGDQLLLAQAERELRGLLSVLPGWSGVLREAELLSAEQDGDVVVAELGGARDAAGRAARWSLRLEFERGPSGLLLTRRLVREARRYSDTRLADYRPVAGRMVPYQRTVRSGPPEEFGAPLRPLTVPKSYIDTYRVLAIREGLDPADLTLFDPPQGPMDRQPWQERQFTYEEISGPGSQPLLAAGIE